MPAPIHVVKRVKMDENIVPFVRLLHVSRTFPNMALPDARSRRLSVGDCMGIFFP